MINLDSLPTQDTIHVDVSPELLPDTPPGSDPTSWWIWGAAVLAFLLMVAFTLFSVRKRLRNRPTSEVDFASVFEDAQKQKEAKALYDDLKKKIHPDRFVGDDDKVELATRMAQEIRASRQSYSQLVKLRDECVELQLLEGDS